MSLKKTNNKIDEEIYIGPGEYPIKIQIKTFKGRKYLDIRKWYLDRKTNEILPTKKGISLSEYQFEDVISLLSKDREKISNWFQEKIDENEVVDSLVKQSEVRRKIAEEVREFKTKSEKLSENKFFKIEYEKGNKQLIINENHQLYKDINKEKSPEKIKKIFELLFISFDQTIQLFDSEESIKVADFEDMLIHNWSIILKNYLKK
jgi:predicted phage tail protein